MTNSYFVITKLEKQSFKKTPNFFHPQLPEHTSSISPFYIQETVSVWYELCHWDAKDLN